MKTNGKMSAELPPAQDPSPRWSGQPARTVEIQAKVSRLFQKRASIAKEHLIDRVSKALNQTVGDLIGQPRLP